MSSYFQISDARSHTIPRLSASQYPASPSSPPMPRAQKSMGKTRHDPLHVQIGADEVQEKYGRLSRPGKRRKSRPSGPDDEEENGEVRPLSSMRPLSLYTLRFVLF